VPIASPGVSCITLEGSNHPLILNNPRLAGFHHHGGSAQLAHFGHGDWRNPTGNHLARLFMVVRLVTP
jgi:hypothetical protein